MPSTFFGLNIGTTGLNYYNAALNTTGHNISNAETEGYSRQQVIGTAAQALRVNNSYGMVGSGVSISSISQARDLYYDQKYWQNSSKYNEYYAKNDYLLQIENYLNEMKTDEGTGNTALYSKFETAMSELAKNPSDLTTRIQFTQAAESLTQIYNEIATNLQDTQKTINSDIAAEVDEINSIAKQIFFLNQQINTIEIRGVTANDLRDERANLVDKLSCIVNLETQETPVVVKDSMGNEVGKTGANNYVVKINGYTLVDETSYNQLGVFPRDEIVNQSDVAGLYEIAWVSTTDGSRGIDFNMSSPSLTGKLRGLIDARDGNNADPLNASVIKVNESAGYVDTVETTPTSRTKISELGIPDTGKVIINNKEYYYDSFDASFDSDGYVTSIKYNGLSVLSETGEKIRVDSGSVKTGTGNVSSGDAVDFKGIPYYMSKLNEFVRTYSNKFNDLCTSGVDLDDKKGLDLFNTVDTAGNNYDLSENMASGTFNSKTASYYRLTALNWSVNEEVSDDPRKVVVSTANELEQGGVESHKLLDSMINLSNDRSMFVQGTPMQFMQATLSDLSVDTKKTDNFAKSQDDILNTISNQRLSISGVDTNEEASNLVIYQKGYNLACKIISVMDEIYEKLINEMGA